jgi:hypothetical protein
MRNGTTTRTDVPVVSERSRPLISWGAIIGGALLGLALLTLLSALWFALAFGTDVNTIRNNLEWFIGASAIVSLLVAGVITGYLSGIRNAGTGFLNGMALWALLLFVTVSVGIPSLLNIFNMGQLTTELQEATDGGLLTPGANQAMWATFWTILLGFLAAGLGGAIGGALAPERSGVTADSGYAMDRGYGRDRDREDRGFDRDRDYDRDRGFDRDREYARDRGYDRDYERDRGLRDDRDYERQGARTADDRDRGYDRDRGDDRDRGYDRDRGDDRDRERVVYEDDRTVGDRDATYIDEGDDIQRRRAS